MPHLITNADQKQSHPLYKDKTCHHNKGHASKVNNKEPEQTASIPKTYDSIKSAAGADMKAPSGVTRAKGRK